MAHWHKLLNLFMSARSPQTEQSEEHAGREAHPLACKLCTQGEDAEEKEKSWNFQ